MLVLDGVAADPVPVDAVGVLVVVVLLALDVGGATDGLVAVAGVGLVFAPGLAVEVEALLTLPVAAPVELGDDVPVVVDAGLCELAVADEESPLVLVPPVPEDDVTSPESPLLGVELAVPGPVVLDDGSAIAICWAWVTG